VAIAEERTREPVETTAHVAFYNVVETDLNDALFAAGVVPTFGKPELFQADPEAA
jgi:hypothetical protein